MRATIACLVTLSVLATAVPGEAGSAQSVRVEVRNATPIDLVPTIRVEGRGSRFVRAIELTLNRLPAYQDRSNRLNGPFGKGRVQIDVRNRSDGPVVARGSAEWPTSGEAPLAVVVIRAELREKQGRIEILIEAPADSNVARERAATLLLSRLNLTCSVSRGRRAGRSPSRCLATVRRRFAVPQDSRSGMIISRRTIAPNAELTRNARRWRAT